MTNRELTLVLRRWGEIGARGLRAAAHPRAMGPGRMTAAAERQTGAGRRSAFVFTIRGARVRLVTAYDMTPQQHEIYEEG